MKRSAALMEAANSCATSFTPSSPAVAISVRAMPAVMARDCTGTEAGQRSPVAAAVFSTVQPAACHRRFAIHHALHVVKRRIALAVGIDAKRIAGFVRAGVPAPYREVEAARKRERA